MSFNVAYLYSVASLWFLYLTTYSIDLRNQVFCFGVSMNNPMVDIVLTPANVFI